MNTKYTLLSRIDLAIIEEIIAHCGSVTDFNCIYDALAKEYSKAEVKNKISKLKKAGWLVRIKRGIYAVTNIDSHNFANISPLVISSILVPDSYVSFEFALNHYGLFDQLPQKVIAVTALKSKKYTFQNLDYQFVKTKPQLVFGFKEVAINGQKAKVAELEKAILDFLYFRNDTYTVDLVLEKLKESKKEFDFEKLINYGLKHSLTVKRCLGFLLDLVGAEATELYQETKTSKGYSKLTKNSNKFNAKWRLYYETRFAQ
ncbi:MAG: type IV toxin-antitoxin system AbiEi family antitoxin domain-containing protein [Actinomycetota bacterium]|nr:type IV toxin-antitoxin system AbiEi family antitoxin domain-containing protein [Actinomycetota bacterium]